MILLQPGDAIIAKVVEEPVHETTVVDVLIGSLGLSGLLLIVGAVAGLALGALLVWFKKRRGADALEITAQTLELSPTQEKR